MDYTVLVNKTHPISPEKINEVKLVEIKNNIDEDQIFLEEKTYQQFLKLKEAVYKRGYIIDICSGYRTYERSQQLFDMLKAEKGEEYASKSVALPGTSEHNTGLALDYCIYEDGQYLIEHDISKYDACHYTNSIAHKYGFILRYPKGKEDITGYMYEAWHLRYVGEKLATYLFANKLTLDDYYKED